jgi:hypothetical protein
MTPKNAGTGSKRSVATGLLLASLGIVHSLWPRVLWLDWPAVVLIVSGALLCFSARMVALLPYVKRLKLGEAEIELQDKVRDLNQNIEQLEEVSSDGRARHAKVSLKGITDTTPESTILELASKDKCAALVRLAIEIEKEMAQLCSESGANLHGPTWRQMVEALTQKGILDPVFANALIEFRDVRNRVIHSGLRGPIKDDLLTGAIDSGLQLLRRLKAGRTYTVSTT